MYKELKGFWDKVKEGDDQQVVLRSAVHAGNLDSFLAAAIFAAAFSLFAAGSNPPQVNLPDWMQQAAAKPIGTYSAETDAVVLMDET